jgi:ABC-type amino acid transport substrate-binding protein
MFRSLLIALTLFTGVAQAETQLKVIVPSENDTYSINARVLSRFISKYLPEQPSVVIQTMPGAASLIATNHLYNVAPKDGNTIGAIYKDIPMVGVLGGENIRFDVKKFNWIGSNADGRKDAVIVWANTRNKSLLVGSENYPGISLAFFVRDIGKQDYKIITGYANPGLARLALEQKEVDAVIYNLLGIKTQKPNWLKEDSGIYPVLQFGNGPNRHPDFRGVQTLHEMVQSDQDQKILEIVEASLATLRPFVAPPNVPEKRVAELREAFNKAVRDPEYLDEAKKMNFEVNPIEWQEFNTLIYKISNIDEKTIERLKSFNEVKK